jgi:hypothetical protein
VRTTSLAANRYEAWRRELSTRGGGGGMRGGELNTRGGGRMRGGDRCGLRHCGPKPQMGFLRRGVANCLYVIVMLLREKEDRTIWVVHFWRDEKIVQLERLCTCPPEVRSSPGPEEGSGTP